MRFRIFLLCLTHFTSVFNDNLCLGIVTIDHRIHRLCKQILCDLNALAEFRDCLVRKLFAVQLHIIACRRNIRTSIRDAVNVIGDK